MLAQAQAQQPLASNLKTVPKTAKVFMNGRSQAVRLPKNDWSEFLEAQKELKNSGELDMFADDENLFACDSRPQERQLFDDWVE